MADTVNPESPNFNNIGSSPNWVRPNDLMKSRKLRTKRHALQARFSGSQPLRMIDQFKTSRNGNTDSPSTGVKRGNPFIKCLPSKSLKLSPENDSSENSSDGSLFHLFDSQPIVKAKSNDSHNFSSLFKNEEKDNTKVQEASKINWSKDLLVDWSLKSRVRFMSSKPFQWKHTFKTSEEASGTTGFVRCMNSKSDAGEGRTLDTSTNAQFYQCCLLWQHPSLPFYTLFPRDKQKISAQTGIYGSDQKIMNSLHTEWGESLRSLYQLLRVRQCPYFYVCAQSFTCVFRAAGTAGFTHTHALITPTSRGFRDSMKKEGVEFSMPLYNKSSQTETDEFLDEEDTTETLPEEGEHTDFLETLGLETSQFPSLNQSRVKTESEKFRNIDGSSESLVYVEDMELQGLINFILNCDVCVSNTGTLAGVPPTLLSPVGFHGGTLKSVKVSGATIRTAKGETQHSIDIQGPILPTSVLHLSSLLSSSCDSFSVSLTPLNSTLPFCTITPSVVGSSMPMAFANEGLVDCGLGKEVRRILCHSGDEITRGNLPTSYRDVKYENRQYSWSSEK